MWSTIKSLFKHGHSGGTSKDKLHKKYYKEARFTLTADDINVGELVYKDGIWNFKYSEEFKKHLNEYNLIIGFPDVDKNYESEDLWPFFQIRIPGLKQPAVKEILEKENIDEDDEVSLLKYFGKKTIANPYKLEFG